MGSKGFIVREAIYKRFSKNLDAIKAHPDISIVPDLKDGYICPLCLDIFDRSALLQESDNPLTLEDIPPKSLGGRPLILTCRKCNSFCGHTLDNHLLMRLNELDAREMLPNVSYKTSFRSEKGTINGKINVSEKGEWKIDLMNTWSNPEKANRFFEEVFPPLVIKNPLFHFSSPEKGYQTNSFRIYFPNKSDERRAYVGLLKIAYLKAFSILGNAFLINSGLYKVREQIMAPDSMILPGEFLVDYNFPKSFEGVNIIHKPDKLKCFLIVFYLWTKSKKRQFACALPGPSEPGIGIYENIENVLFNKPRQGFTDCEIGHLGQVDFVAQSEHAWGAHWYWQNLCQGEL